MQGGDEAKCLSSNGNELLKLSRDQFIVQLHHMFIVQLHHMPGERDFCLLSYYRKKIVSCLCACADISHPRFVILMALGDCSCLLCLSLFCYIPSCRLTNQI